MEVVIDDEDESVCIGGCWRGTRLASMDVRRRLHLEKLPPPRIPHTRIRPNLSYRSLAKVETATANVNHDTDMVIRTAAKWANVHQVIIALRDPQLDTP
jgi:hypothetical protein